MYERAGITPHGEFCFAEPHDGGGSTWHLFEDRHIELYRSYSSADVVLMQFTGLKDKTGKEIYDGDILRRTYRFIDPPTKRSERREEVSAVVYDERDARFMQQLSLGSFRGFFQGEEYEVIGNIHEHPQLLSTSYLPVHPVHEGEAKDE